MFVGKWSEKDEVDGPQSSVLSDGTSLDVAFRGLDVAFRELITDD